jgi:GNAT superfamily N-acetyltransferase
MRSVMIRPVAVEEVRPLRQAILRPHLPPEHSVYAGDEAAEALHVGAFVEGRLVGVASALHEARPGEDDAGAWRLRGVAVLEPFRGHGVGRRLVEACVAHARAQGGTRLWFNAAARARVFYERMGFKVEGEELVSPETGPYYLMWREIDS